MQYVYGGNGLFFAQFWHVNSHIFKILGGRGVWTVYFCSYCICTRCWCESYTYLILLTCLFFTMINVDDVFGLLCRYCSRSQLWSRKIWHKEFENFLEKLYQFRYFVEISFTACLVQRISYTWFISTYGWTNNRFQSQFFVINY